MGENEVTVGLDLSAATQKKGRRVVDLDSPSPENRESPLRSVLCLKTDANMREIEEIEDCFILDFDPNDSLDLSKLSIPDDLNSPGAPDISVLAEKGQVACRDYPHSRHLCLKNPFGRTPHESYCQLCFCYVCDESAPCKYWFGVTGHCHAIDDQVWKTLRRAARGANLV
ncbi:hypothetical protein U1Q18_004903 [Sarracenia purpurea var. burkii]